MTDPRRLIDEGADEFERELLRAGRRDRMSPRSRAAILAGLGVTAPLPFAVTDPTHAATAASASTKALMAKVAAGTLGVFGLATGVYLTQATSNPAPPTPQTSPAIVIQASPPEPEAPSAPVLENGAVSAHEAKEIETSQSEPEVRSAPRPAPEAKGVRQPDSISRELAQVESARSALRGGDPARSLRILSEYTRDYPKGNLRTEATVLRIEALSASGDRAAAARLGKQFLAQAPNGPYARRIRSLLAQSDSTSN